MTVNTTYNLGQYSYKLPRVTNKQCTIVLKKKEEYAFYKLDPYTGVVDPNTTYVPDQELTAEKAQQLYKTKGSAGLLFATFFPVRTDTPRDVTFEVLCPLTRRASCELLHEKFGEKLLLISFIIIDLATAIFRLFTVVPMIIWNSLQSNHLPVNFGAEKPEAVFVQNKTTWTLEAKRGANEVEELVLELEYGWPLNSQPPLRWECLRGYKWNGIWRAYTDIFDKINVYDHQWTSRWARTQGIQLDRQLEDGATTCLEFCSNGTLFDLELGCYTRKDTSGEDIFLFQDLQDHIDVVPKVAIAL